MSNAQKKPISNVPSGAYLVFNQTIYPLSLPVTHICRKPENDLVIQDSSVSRLHAQIRVENGNFVFHDLKSHIGPIINQTKVKQHILKAWMLIFFGNVMVVFVQEDKRVTENLEQVTGEMALRD